MKNELYLTCYSKEVWRKNPPPTPPLLREVAPCGAPGAPRGPARGSRGPRLLAMCRQCVGHLWEVGHWGDHVAPRERHMAPRGSPEVAHVSAVCRQCVGSGAVG